MSKMFKTVIVPGIPKKTHQKNTQKTTQQEQQQNNKKQQKQKQQKLKKHIPASSLCYISV